MIGRVFRIRLNKIVLRDGTIILGGPKSSIVDLADEIFVNKNYNPEFLQIKPNDVVLDIGANIGVFSVYAAKCGAGVIYSVEPLYQNVLLINKNFRINKLKSPVTIKKAVSDKNGLSKFYVYKLDSHGRLSKRSYDKEIYKSIKVETTTFSKIIRDNRIKKVDFLKIDCEGGEGKIIQSLGYEEWNKINKIALEYHDGISVLTHVEIVKLLNKMHYKVRMLKIDKNLGYIYGWRA